MVQVKIDANYLFNVYKTKGIFEAQNEFDKIAKEKGLKFFEAVALKQNFMNLYNQDKAV